LGTLVKCWDSLEDLRRAVRIRVIDDIITMLNRVGEGRARDDAVLVMAGAYRSYAHHHPGRYSAFTRMPMGGDDPEYAAATRGAAAPVISVLSSYGLDGDEAFYAALEFWSALHGFVLLEMTGVMDDIDTDAVFSDMVLRLAAGLEKRTEKPTGRGAAVEGVKPLEVPHLDFARRWGPAVLSPESR